MAPFWTKTSNNLHELKPTLIMVLVESVFALVNIGYKLSTNDGMNRSILVAYRFMFGAAFIVPIAFFVERKTRPKFTWKIALYGFLCGLSGGSLGQNLYLKSLVLTSATFASAMSNLIPAITFILAISLRLESLEWNAAAGKAKVLGTILGLSGAMLLTFYRGPDLYTWKNNINLLETTTSHHHSTGQIANHEGGDNVVLGALLALASCVCYSLWFIIQAKAMEQYPCPYSITALMTTSASIQGAVYALCTQRAWSDWHLGWNIRLLTVAVAGILCSGLTFTLVAWCVRMKGPLFVSIFQPLVLVMVAFAGSLLLNEKLRLGTLLGSILIVVGLYVVSWGKGKEYKNVRELTPENIQNQVEMSLPPPWSIEETEEEDESKEDKRDSPASSEVLSGICLYT